MITERTLRKWRKEALELDEVVQDRQNRAETVHDPDLNIVMGLEVMDNVCARLLVMTRELLDQHLLRRK